MKLVLFVLFVCVACVVAGAAGCNVPDTANKPAERLQQNTNQPAPTSTASPATTQESYDFSSIDELLARIARTDGGCALVVVKDDRVIYRKGFGSHGPDKVIPVASASKWFSLPRFLCDLCGPL